jgi:hypothetical protein
LWQVGSPNVLWRIEWDNPERQQNLVSHSFNPPNPGFNSANFIGQGEENVPVSFTISRAGGGVVPPPPQTKNKLTITVVTLEGERPIDQATVEITEIEGAEGGLAKKTTGKDGKVVFDLPQSSGALLVAVQVTATGFEQERRRYRLPEEGPDQVIHMRAKSKNRIANFAVIDTSQHKELPDAKIEVGGQSKLTDQRGRAEFELPPGPFPYLVTKKDFLDNHGKIEMTSEKDVFETVLMVAKSGGKIIVKVTDIDTKLPIKGAEISLDPKQPHAAGGLTDDQGVLIRSLPPGPDHEIFAKAAGFEDKHGIFETQPGQDFPLPVEMKKIAEKKFEPPPESKQPTLRKGAPEGDKWVEYLQSLLGLPTNGIFDQKVHDAVIAFQRKNKLQMVDGIVGNETWAALRKAPKEKPSTDGRAPNTFVEKGPEARWYTEKQKEVLTFDANKLKLKLVSLGDADVAKVKARVRVTNEQGVNFIDDFEISAAEQSLPEGGFVHSVTVPLKFAPGKHTLRVEAYMPQELGGDLFDDKIPVEITGNPAPPPPPQPPPPPRRGEKRNDPE